jgi:hypothetical protein
MEFLQLRWYGHVERMQTQRMLEQIATVTMEGKRKRGRLRKRWRHEAEEKLNVIGVKNRGDLQRPLGMEDDCFGSQGPQRTVGLEEERRLKRRRILMCLLQPLQIMAFGLFKFGVNL